VTEDGTRVNGEKLKPPTRSEKLKSWATLIGAIAALAGASTAMLSSLGVDKLIARRHGEQSKQTKEAYQVLVDSNTKLREALRKAFERIRSLEKDVGRLEEDYRTSMWMRMAAGTARPPAPPPAPDIAPPITDDVESLLADPKPVSKKSSGLFGMFGAGGEESDEGLELLEEAAPPKWEQVQEQAQEE